MESGKIEQIVVRADEVSGRETVVREKKERGRTWLSTSTSSFTL
jgi:hypothetical protein